MKKSIAFSPQSIVSDQYSVVSDQSEVASVCVSTNRSILTFSLLILTAFLLIGCKTPQVTTNQSSIRTDSIYIIEKMVPVEVPGAVIKTQSINIDSLANLLRSGVSPQVISKTLIREDPETGLKVGILIDRLGNLTALCEQQDRMIEVLQKEINRLTQITETKETVITEPVSFWKKVKQAIIWIIVGAVLAVVLYFFRILLPIR